MANLTKTLTVPQSDGTKVQYSFNATEFNSKTSGYYENLPFVACSTAAGTAAKTVTCTGFELVDGARIAVKFSNTNSASNPTLNVNSTGAKSIYYKNAAITAGYLLAGTVMEFIYNATNQRYELIGFVDTNSDLKTASTNTSSKIFLVGATSQGSGGQTTYSHDTAFVDTSGIINSNDPVANSTSTVVTTAQKGIAGGVAPLDSDGKISATYLPSYVDDVIEGKLDSTTSFTDSAGTTINSDNASSGKIYVDTNSNKTYRWGGTAFVEISAGTYSTTIVGASTSATTNAAVTSNGVYLNEVYNGTTVSTHKIVGAGGATVTSDSSGNVTITSPDAGDLGAITSVTASGTAPLTLSATKSGTGVTISGSVAQATASANGTIKVAAVRSSAITSTTGETTSGRYYGLELDSNGKAFVNVPWTNTNTKVTAVGNHYSPAADTDSELSVDASSTTAASWNSTSLVTGVNLQRDAAGHVVGVTVDSIKMPANPDTDTHYTSHLYATSSSGTAHATSATSNPYLRLFDNTTARESVQLKGSGATSVSATNGVITISSTTTTYSAGTGISLSGTTFSNSGVRAVATGSTNGTISVNTNGTSAEVAVAGLGTAAYQATSYFALADHTHNYAGSSSAGGSATSAVKLDTATAGDASTPVYFTDGKPKACTSLDLNTTGTAAAWTTARTLTVDGDASGSVSIKGNANMTLTLAVADDSHNHTIANVDELEDRLAAIEDCLVWHEF